MHEVEFADEVEGVRLPARGGDGRRVAGVLRLHLAGDEHMQVGVPEEGDGQNDQRHQDEDDGLPGGTAAKAAGGAAHRRQWAGAAHG